MEETIGQKLEQFAALGDLVYRLGAESINYHISLMSAIDLPTLFPKLGSKTHECRMYTDSIETAYNFIQIMI